MKITLPTKEQIDSMRILETTETKFSDFAETFAFSVEGYWVLPSPATASLASANIKCEIKAQDPKIQTGVRPIINFDLIKNQSKKKAMIDGGFTVLCGVFPQSLASKAEGEMLQMFESMGQLDTTRVFKVQNESYTLVKPLVGNERYIKYKDNYYKLENIEWLVDNDTNLAITKNVLYSSVFGPTHKANDSIILQFLNTSFIIQSLDDLKDNLTKAPNGRKAKGPSVYGFTSKRIDEDSLIEACVNADVPVFLHGKSSDGKSARVKAIDPDCEIIYLRTATPETLCGKAAYDTTNGKVIDIKPSWLKRLEEKCINHPERIHILFLDEITNALHSIQGMAFNIVLDKEVNGIWKLPDNVRIVAAGNEAEESMAANTLVEPLFNRFAHVYINTTARSWLNWAIAPLKEKYLDYVPQSKAKRIHPAIIAYIQSNGNEVLRTKYTGKEPNADPRKWEMASRLLYSTNNPQALRCLIGKALTSNFDAFCKNLDTLITVSDVVNKTKAALDFELDCSESKVDTGNKYAVVVSLSQCTSSELDVVREFVAKIAKELVVVFDAMWTQLNPDEADALLAMK